MSTRPEIIVLHESLTESVMSDLVTFTMIVSVVWVGGFLQSTLAEIVGWFLICVYIIAKISMYQSECKMTPQQAANWLRNEFGVNAN